MATDSISFAAVEYQLLNCIHYPLNYFALVAANYTDVDTVTQLAPLNSLLIDTIKQLFDDLNETDITITINMIKHDTINNETIKILRHVLKKYNVLLNIISKIKIYTLDTLIDIISEPTIKSIIVEINYSLSNTILPEIINSMVSLETNITTCIQMRMENLVHEPHCGEFEDQRLKLTLIILLLNTNNIISHNQQFSTLQHDIRQKIDLLSDIESQYISNHYIKTPKKREKIPIDDTYCDTTTSLSLSIENQKCIQTYKIILLDIKSKLQSGDISIIQKYFDVIKALDTIFDIHSKKINISKIPEITTEIDAINEIIQQKS